MRIPHRLVDEIAEGRCVAFVGAGFVMPTVPGWVDLLADLATLTPPETNALVDELYIRVFWHGRFNRAQKGADQFATQGFLVQQSIELPLLGCQRRSSSLWQYAFAGF